MKKKILIGGLIVVILIAGVLTYVSITRGQSPAVEESSTVEILEESSKPKEVYTEPEVSTVSEDESSGDALVTDDQGRPSVEVKPEDVFEGEVDDQGHANTSKASEPEISATETSAPETSEPETSKPEISEPVTSKPEISEPVTSTPSQPVTSNEPSQPSKPRNTGGTSGGSSSFPGFGSGTGVGSGTGGIQSGGGGGDTTPGSTVGWK